MDRIISKYKFNLCFLYVLIMCTCKYVNNVRSFETTVILSCTTIKTRQVSSMIHSASSEHCFLLLCFSSTDGQHVQKQLSLPAVTLGWPSGSIEVCHHILSRLKVKWNSHFSTKANTFVIFVSLNSS